MLASLFFVKWYASNQSNKRLSNNFIVLASELTKQTQNRGVLEMELKEIKKAFPELEKS